MSDAVAPAPSGELPELAGVSWRPLVDEASLRRVDRHWSRWAIAHLLPFLAVAAGLPLLSLLLLPMSAIALGFAYVIPRLYAARGAGALREPWGRRGSPSGSGLAAGAGLATGAGSATSAQVRALGLLGDLVGHAARDTLADTGFVVEPGRFGVWVIGPAGALLVRGAGRRAQCYCVHATGDDLPRADRIAHLLLALRADESGFATVANLTFSGAVWRLRRVLGTPGRAALAAAVTVARLRH